VGKVSPPPGQQVAAEDQSGACEMTENDLYAMGMESPTAWAKMAELCKLFNISYPPKYTKESK
jgi:hypothetical protein